MQIVEVSVAGVRSAVLHMRRSDVPLSFLLYPMIHIAEPHFYAAVTERLRRCDLIVAEGVRGGSAAVSTLTATYRLPARLRKSGLVEQDIDYTAIGVPVICPDLTGAQFSERWKAVPLWERAMVMSLAPVVALDAVVFGSRRAFARELEETDLDWQDRFDETGPNDVMSVLGDQRDRLLLAALDRIHRERRDEEITVAVVYGAAHIAPAIHGMRALHGYRVRAAEWLTVFDL